MKDSTHPKQPGMIERLKNHKWFALVILALAQSIVVFDNGALMIGAEALSQELSATLPQLQAANTIYPMIGATLMIAGGMLGLIIGWRLQLQLGVGLLVISSLLAASTSSMTVLVYGARVMAGLAGCLMVPAVFGYCASCYKGRDQAMAFGVIASSIGLAGILAPVLLGAGLDIVGFNITFLFVAGYCALVLMLTFALPQAVKTSAKVRFDYIGMLLVATGLLCVIAGALFVAQWGIITPISTVSIAGIAPTLPLIALGFVILYFFIRWEEYIEPKIGSAIFPRALRRNNQVKRGMFFCGMTWGLVPTMAFITVTYLQLTGELSALQSGLLFCISSLGMVISSILTPSKLGHWSSYRIINTGIAICSIGILMMFLSYSLQGVSSYIFLAHFIFGLGGGFFAAHAPVIIISSVSQQDGEQSSGLQTTSRNFGKALGVAILGTVLAFGFSSEVKDRVAAGNLALAADTMTIIEHQPMLPFVGNESLIELMTEASIIEGDHQTLLAVVADSRLSAMRQSLSGFLVLLFVGFLVAIKLPRESRLQET